MCVKAPSYMYIMSIINHISAMLTRVNWENCFTVCPKASLALRPVNALVRRDLTTFNQSPFPSYLYRQADSECSQWTGSSLTLWSIISLPVVLHANPKSLVFVGEFFLPVGFCCYVRWYHDLTVGDPSSIKHTPHSTNGSNSKQKQSVLLLPSG